jgi:hypothetical protein
VSAAALRRPAGVGLFARLAAPGASAALIVAGVAGQAAGHIDSDVSWFLTLAEKYLDGASFYDGVVVIEPNPPVSFLSLVPVVALARLLHLPPEPLLVAVVTLFALASLRFCAAALGPTLREDRGLLLNGALWLVLVAPALVFAQREHLALLALAPLLASLSVSAAEHRYSAGFIALLALGAAFGVAFKPFFGLPIVFALLALCWRERSLRPLLRPEILLAGALLVAYAGAVALVFPAYVARIIPFGVDVYSPAQESYAKLATETLAPVYLALCVGLVFCARGVPKGALAQTSFWASIGFFLSFALQRKGWINHAYPGVALLLLSWLAFSLDEARRKAQLPPLVKFVFLPAFVAAPFFFAAARQWSDAEEYAGLAAAVRAHAPAHPRLVTLAINCDVGHPLTRHVGGVWVGGPCALWTSSYVGRILESGAAQDEGWRARLLAYRHADLTGFARALDVGRADVVIVESKALRDWALRQEELAGALAPFEKTAEAGELEIWTRRRPQ